MEEIVYKTLHLFCGIGGGSLGFDLARADYRGISGRFETICGIDNDSEACEDFEKITGSKALCLDLFDRKQYEEFHGEAPPSEWEEVTPGRLRHLVGEIPDLIFTSPPCKGFSGLLSEKNSKTRKYQALNRLTVRSIELTLEAFKDDLPALILFENVPRITTRGKKLLDDIKSKLRFYGYEINETEDQYHDCGELGGLSQHRKRFLLIARNPQKIDSFIYKPPKQRVRSIGEALEKLPLPSEAFGRIHDLPKLQFKTWLRLALIRAGGDWRSLETCEWENLRIVKRNGEGFLEAESPVPNLRTGFSSETHLAIYRVQPWDKPAKTVTGAMRPNNGAICVADPRLTCQPRAGAFEVMKWDEPAKTVIGSGDIHAGAAAIAEPRIPSEGERGVFVIIAEDGTWHRPLTTLELLVLQGFPLQLHDGTPFVMAGNSDARWRERIGNAVPPAAASAIAETILLSMLAQEKGDWLMSSEDIWVVPISEEEVYVNEKN